MRHRGPDDAGSFVDAEAGIALGSRRLAIIDLSAHGHQPMVSSDGRYVVSYNGEIYNFAGLRAELEGLGHRFRGSSDTEVLVASVAAPGGARHPGPMQRDVRAGRVGHAGNSNSTWPVTGSGRSRSTTGGPADVFLFGSELKALRAHPAFRAEVDRDVLALYFRHNCVPAPYSIFKGIAQLRPGTFVTLGLATAPTGAPRGPGVLVAARRGRDGHGVTLGRDRGRGARCELEGTLRDAVGIRMRADVPLGAFLSGGIDSSLVVALMQAHSASKVKTFTIAFEDAGYDEATHARRVASHLGTEHTELLMTAADALDTIRRLPALYDEPFADSSQIPTAVLARADARARHRGHVR